jgi:hypothetical protein
MERIEEPLDGFYTYQDNYKQLDEGSVAKEKIRSAIRFYKLGNESIEMEHKILNYWIGFEQLFAAVDSEEDSIKRIKSFFIAMNGALYMQSRLQYLIRSIEKRCDTRIKPADLAGPVDLVKGNTLLSKRLIYYKSWFADRKQIKTLLMKHVSKLEQHITRIYRMLKEDPQRPGSGIRWNKLFEDSYLTGGVGIGADLKYVMLRVDGGALLYTPPLPSGYKWLWENKLPLYGIVIGFGYPF